MSGLDLVGQEYFYDLLNNPRWIERRVHTIQLIDDERLLHRVSLDIDLEDVRRRLNRSLGLNRHSGAARRIPWRKDEPLQVPLGILSKEFLLDFSVVDQEKNPLSLMTSEEDTKVWQNTLLRIVSKDECAEAANFRQKYRECYKKVLRAISSDIIEIVGPIDSYRRLGLGNQDSRWISKRLTEATRPHIAKAVLRLDTSYALQAAVAGFKINDTSRWESLVPTSDARCASEDVRREIREGAWRKIREEVWRELFKIVPFAHYLKLAIGHFVPVVSIAGRGNRGIVKYEYQTSVATNWRRRDAVSYEIAVRCERAALSATRETMSLSSQKRDSDAGGTDEPRRGSLIAQLLPVRALAFRQRLGISPAWVEIDTSLATSAEREHLKVICPKGVYIENYQYEPYNSSTRDEYLRARITRERATLYTKPQPGLRENSMLEFQPDRVSKFILYIRPRLTGFRTSALIAVAVATALSLASWKRADKVMAWNDGDPPELSALMAILLFTVSLLSYVAVRPGEHAYRSRLLSGPRTAVVLSCALVVSIAGCAEFQGDVGAIKIVAAISFFVCLVLLVYLAFVSGQGERLGRRVAKREDVALYPSRRGILGS